MEFRPLTIFTGANSSGKSTILQSILLVTQTLQSSIASRSIVLNGWFKKFGTYSDIVNRRIDKKKIKFGFTLSNDGSSDMDMVYRYRYAEEIMSVNCEFELSSDGKAECLQPVLRHTRLVTNTKNEKGETRDALDIKKGGARSDEERAVIEKCKATYQLSDFEYAISSKNKLRLGYYGHDYADWNLLGVGLFHFLPSYAIVYTKYRDQLKTGLINCLMMGKDLIRNERDKEKVISLVKDRVLEIVEEIYEKKKYNEDGRFEKVRESIINDMSFSRLIQVFRYVTLDLGEKQKYVDSIAAELDSIKEEYVTERLPLYFFSGVDFVRDFFNEKIKYLGPLREEPRS